MFGNQTSTRLTDTAEYCTVPLNRSQVALSANYRPDILAWACTTGLICSAGVVFNLLMLTILLRSPSWRHGAGLLIVHLLICHFAMSAAVLPMAIYLVWQQAVQVNPQNCQSCRYLQPLHASLTFLINWSDAFLACHRIVAIALPQRFRSFNHKPVQYLALSVCWLLTLTTSIPPMFNLTGLYRMVPLGACTILLTSRVFQVLIALHAYCPLALTVFGSIVIIVRFMTGVANRTVVHVVIPPVVRTMSERQRRTTQMLLASFGVSLVCQLPLYLVSLTFTSLLTSHPKILLLFRTLTAIQYAVTPVVFLGMNKDYQRKAAALFSSRLFPARLTSLVAHSRSQRPSCPNS